MTNQEAIAAIKSNWPDEYRYTILREALTMAIKALDKTYDIEFLSEQVHNAWWEEKKRQGFHAPVECDNGTGNDLEKFKKFCGFCHTDMYTYAELPENIKDYDRVMVRTVLEAIKKTEEV